MKMHSFFIEINKKTSDAKELALMERYSMKVIDRSHREPDSETFIDDGSDRIIESEKQTKLEHIDRIKRHKHVKTRKSCSKHKKRRCSKHPKHRHHHHHHHHHHHQPPPPPPPASTAAPTPIPTPPHHGHSDRSEEDDDDRPSISDRRNRDRHRDEDRDSNDRRSKPNRDRSTIWKQEDAESKEFSISFRKQQRKKTELQSKTEDSN